MDGWKTFGIIVIVIFVWYFVCMILSIILAKVGSKKDKTSGINKAARILKGLSILNYPFKKLNDLAMSVDENDKLRNVAIRKIGDSVQHVGQKITQKGTKLPVEDQTQKGGFGYDPDYIEEIPDF